MLRTSSLAGGGPSIAQAVFLEDTQPIDVTIYGRRYLQSGYVETDTTTFDTSIFTAKSLLNIVERFGGGNTSAMIAYSGFLYISTGGNYGIADSPDGITWTARGVPVTGTPAQTFVRWSDVDYNFLTGGQGSLVAISSDGVTWTGSTVTSFAGQTVNDAAYGAGVWVVVGNNNNIATSPDGTTWTGRTSAISGNILSIAFSDTLDLFVIGTSTGLMATSPDGITWTARTSTHGTDDIHSIAWGNDKFVAVGDKYKISTSVDGITWVDTGQTPVLGVLRDVSFGNGTFVCANASSDNFLVSTDGVAWVEIDSGSGSAAYSSVINGDYVILGTVAHKLLTADLSRFAGSTVAYAENNENQYIRIT